MKIEYEDESYIEFYKSDRGIIISIGARDSSNKLNIINNSVELSREEFDKLVSDVSDISTGE